MNEIILLGAGASVEAGIPSSFDLTRRILQDLRSSPQLAPYAHLVSYVIGGLLFRTGIQGGDPLNDGIDVEELIGAIQLLAERNSLEIAPFVGTWHPMINEFDKSRRYPMGRLERLYQIIYMGIVEQMSRAFQSNPSALGSGYLETEIKKVTLAVLANPSSNIRTDLQQKIGEIVGRIITKWITKLRNERPSRPSGFEKEFSEAVESVATKSGEGRVFEETLELVIHELIGIAWMVDEQRVKYLEPILEILNTQKKLAIATLNYDNCIELLASSKGVGISTGISNWSRTGTFKSIEEGISLLKLHGAIDWEIKKNQRSKERPIPHTIVQKATTQNDQRKFYRPAIIFGQRNKLTAEGPFLELLRFFKQELSEADKLTIIGYSFRDAHINIYISDWLNENEKHHVSIIDLKTPQFAEVLLRCCPGRVVILEETAGTAIKKLFL